MNTGNSRDVQFQGGKYMEKVIKNQFLTGERALFGTKDTEIYDTYSRTASLR